MLLQVSHIPLDVVSILLACSGLVFSYILLSIILDPCRTIPGPFIARFTRLWNVYQVAKGQYEVSSEELHHKYGPIVRVQPGQYITGDLATAKAMLQISGPVWVKDKWHDAWSPLPPAPPSLFSDRNPKHHAAQRKKVSALYSMTSIKGYEPFVDDSINILKARLTKAANLGQTLDLAAILQCYAFDVVSSITFGERFGTLDEGKDNSELFYSIDQKVIYSTFAGFFPGAHSWLYPRVVKWTRSAYVYGFCASRIASIRAALISKKETSTIKGEPFITRLIKKQDEDPQKISTGDIHGTALSNVFAGSDTTSTSLCGILYHLIRSPRVLSKLRQELDDATAQGKVSSPISFTDSEALPYLQACIKEGMRLHRAGALPLNREVPAGGHDILGYRIPAGSVIGISAWAIHRDKEVYGEDADDFRPERRLEFAEVEGKLAEVESSYITFGRGSRSCIGKHIAMVEIEKLIPELVRSFDFDVLDWEKVEKAGGGLKTRGWQFAKVISFEAKLKLRAA